MTTTPTAEPPSRQRARRAEAPSPIRLPRWAMVTVVVVTVLVTAVMLATSATTFRRSAQPAERELSARADRLLSQIDAEVAAVLSANPAASAAADRLDGVIRDALLGDSGPGISGGVPPVTLRVAFVGVLDDEAVADQLSALTWSARQRLEGSRRDLGEQLDIYQTWLGRQPALLRLLAGVPTGQLRVRDGEKVVTGAAAVDRLDRLAGSPR